MHNHIHRYINAHMCIFTHTHTCINTYNMCILTHIHTHTHTHINTHTCINTYNFPHPLVPLINITQKYIHTHKFMHACIHTYIHTAMDAFRSETLRVRELLFTSSPKPSSTCVRRRICAKMWVKKAQDLRENVSQKSAGSARKCGSKRRRICAKMWVYALIMSLSTRVLCIRMKMWVKKAQDLRENVSLCNHNEPFNVRTVHSYENVS